jgi:hypothetical protein
MTAEESKLLDKLFEDAIENLRQARRHVTDDEGRQLLYHAGLTLRTLQERYALSKRAGLYR